MSVRTPADEKQDEAQEGIQKAVNAISEILTRQVYGWDGYTDEWDEKLRQTFNDLLNIQHRHGW